MYSVPQLKIFLALDCCCDVCVDSMRTVLTVFDELSNS